MSRLRASPSPKGNKVNLYKCRMEGPNELSSIVADLYHSAFALAEPNGDAANVEGMTISELNPQLTS